MQTAPFLAYLKATGCLEAKKPSRAAKDDGHVRFLLNWTTLVCARYLHGNRMERRELRAKMENFLAPLLNHGSAAERP